MTRLLMIHRLLHRQQQFFLLFLHLAILAISRSGKNIEPLSCKFPTIHISGEDQVSSGYLGKHRQLAEVLLGRLYFYRLLRFYHYK